MTRAPATLLAVRTLLLDHLDVDPDTVRSGDLEPSEVGIVPDAAHRGGYHCGSDRVVSNDYSVVESTRDSSGLTLDAAALDVGVFKVSSGGQTHDLRSFSTWCVGQCVANAPDTRDIREIIYSPDGVVVKRWDRLGRRSSGDSSHRGHTHFSFFRDAIKAGRDQTPLFRRYLTTIGLIEGDDMDQATFDRLLKGALTGPGDDAKAVQANLRALPWAYPVRPDASALNVLFVQALPQLLAGVRGLGEVIARESASPDEVRALLAGLPRPEPVDEQAIVAGILAGLTPERIAAAIPAALAGQVADELARRMAS